MSTQNKHKDLLLIVIIFLIGWVGFRSGQYYERENQPDLIKINLTTPNDTLLKEEKVKVLARALEQKGIAIPVPNKIEENKTTKNHSPEKKKCLFVGSKNSNKFHTPDCHFASRIKEKNKICFSSREEAEEEGYQPAKECVK